MKKSLLAVFFCGAVLLAAGCSVATPSAPIRPAVPPLRKAEAEKIKARCAAIKSVLMPLEIRGIGLYPRAFELGYTPENICAFLVDSGFNRIYFHVSSEKELDERLKEFLAAAKKSDLPVEIILRQMDFRYRYRGNPLLRKLNDEYPDLPGAVRRVIDFNSKLPEEQGKISGITVIMEPHRFTSNAIVSGQRFAWSEKTYGPGLDNDMLVAETLELLSKVDPGSLPLTVGFADFYQDMVADKKLTKGTAADFLAACKKAPTLMIMSSGSKPSLVISGTQSELEYLGKQHRMLLGIELAGHVSSQTDKLRRRDWRDFIRIIRFVVDNHKVHPEFRGVVISPLAVFEYLIMEQD